jgi:penicillin amidase
MFGELHDIDGGHDYEQSILAKTFSPAALAFLDGLDVTWSAALDNSSLPQPPIPSPEELSIVPGQPQAATIEPGWPGGHRKPPQGNPELSSRGGAADPIDSIESGTIGSNNWAVDGRRSGTGAAVVANDMHLGLSVPNTWYRVRLLYQDPELGPQDVTGVTLPGAPVIVSGSNRYVAWGNTFSCLDIADLVSLELDPANPRHYRTPSGWRTFETFTEVIRVHRNPDIKVEVDETIWGPVVTKGQTKYALACTMHDPEAVNLGLIEVERARNVETALRQANLSGTPVNNFVVGDSAGHIGYSLLGRLPNRVGFDGVAPCSWAQGGRGWQGWLAPEQYPRILNPSNGVLWTANNRILGSADYLRLHVSSPDNGARARQIRDDLLALDHPSEQTLWSVYRDDRALFLAPWQELLISVLGKGYTTNAAWRLARDYVQSWGARAGVDSQGYRLVRRFRAWTLNLLFEPLNARLARYEPNLKVLPEDAAWALIKDRPNHFLNPRFKTYDDLLTHAVDELLDELGTTATNLTQHTWGERNRLQIRHPLSPAVPRLARWLNMPDVPVSGDSHMPKVHTPGHGVSERMIVSPGHEEMALYNMPCGQSGHFLSPFYRSEMQSWLKVDPQSFLPGPAEHRLVLSPPGGG